jgi:hypothetical protein
MAKERMAKGRRRRRAEETSLSHEKLPGTLEKRKGAGQTGDHRI